MKKETENLLAHVSLGGGMKGSKLYVSVVIRPHLIKDLFEGVKSAALCVNVVLINLHQKKKNTSDSLGWTMNNSQRFTHIETNVAKEREPMG